MEQDGKENERKGGREMGLEPGNGEREKGGKTNGVRAGQMENERKGGRQMELEPGKWRMREREEDKWS